MNWTKELLAEKWCKGACGGIGTHTVIKICKKNEWKYAEILGMRKRLIDERPQFGSLKS